VKRPIVLAVVAATTLLASVVVTGPAQAKVSGPNGQIAFTRTDRAAEEDVTYTINPDGSEMSRSCLASRLGGHTGRRTAARSRSDQVWAFLAAPSPTRR
jgi:hypothetical protein